MKPAGILRNYSHVVGVVALAYGRMHAKTRENHRRGPLCRLARIEKKNCSAPPILGGFNPVGGIKPFAVVGSGSARLPCRRADITRSESNPARSLA